MVKDAIESVYTESPAWLYMYLTFEPGEEKVSLLDSKVKYRAWEGLGGEARKIA